MTFEALRLLGFVVKSYPCNGLVEVVARKNKRTYFGRAHTEAEAINECYKAIERNQYKSKKDRSKLV